MKFLAVTACPSGVAHTYMAAEALEKAAKKLGHDIKVETQGSIGIENEISDQEIQDADLVILSNDMGIKNEERFKAKPIMRISISTIVKRAEDIIKKAEEALLQKDNS